MKAAILGDAQSLEIISMIPPAKDLDDKSWVMVAMDLYKIGRLDDAFDCFREAVNNNPSYANAWYNMAAIRNEQGRMGNEAVGYLRKATKLGDKGAENALLKVAEAGISSAVSAVAELGLN